MSMTNSKILSTDEIVQILCRYLLGKISFRVLKSRLEGKIAFDFRDAPMNRRIYDIHIDENIQIVVKKEHLCRMLRKYISKEINDLELSNWAAIIYIMPNFIPDGNSDEERNRSGEGMLWQILQELITPFLFGGLNESIAKKYLNQLNNCAN